MAWRLITEKGCETVETPEMPKRPLCKRDLREVSWEEIPTLYFLGEVLALRNRNQEDLREIHKAKLAYPGVRLIQESAETL